MQSLIQSSRQICWALFEKVFDLKEISAKSLEVSNHFQSLPALRDDEVHLWDFEVLSLGCTDPVEELLKVLSVEEQDKAGRLPSPEDRNFYIATRWLLRALLSSYLCAGQPGFSGLIAVPFERDPQGKPRLPERLHFVSGLEFNLSHSENRLLIAVSRNRSVGVDIEKPICPPAFRKIAARFFAASENELLLRAKDVCESEDLFLRIWTCREALIKAMGNTLFSHQASVHWARTNEGGGLESSSPQWKIQELRLKKDFFAALAVRAS